MIFISLFSSSSGQTVGQFPTIAKPCSLAAILMTDTSKHIRTGFFDDFKSYDTILISVDIHGLLEIENVFIQLSQGLSYFDFSTLKLLDINYQVDIKAYNDIKNVGLKQINNGKFEWRLTKNKWSQFREMTTALYRISTSGHQYLDTESGDIDLESLQVVLSFDEYPLSFWKEHFKAINF